MHYRDLEPGHVARVGSFNRDARGRWYVNITVEQKVAPRVLTGSAIGVDLGLSVLATLSDGQKIAAPQFMRRLETKHANARRANRKRLARTLSAKASNQRRDYLHKVSKGLAVSHDIICVGNVSSKSLAKTNFAKSVLDAGWGMLRQQIEYKAIRHGSIYVEVNEAFTTQTCSFCGCIPEGRPKGIAGLGIRQWECSDCGSVHDRDVNAAINIVRLGLQSLAEGAPALSGEQPNAISAVNHGG